MLTDAEGEQTDSDTGYRLQKKVPNFNVGVLDERDSVFSLIMNKT